MQKNEQETKKSVSNSKWLSKIEAAGNKLPDPAVLFICMGILILILSAMGNALGWKVENPSTGEIVEVTSLLTGEGIRQSQQHADKFGRIWTSSIGYSCYDGIGCCRRNGYAESTSD